MKKFFKDFPICVWIIIQLNGLKSCIPPVRKSAKIFSSGSEMQPPRRKRDSAWPEMDFFKCVNVRLRELWLCVCWPPHITVRVTYGLAFKSPSERVQHSSFRCEKHSCSCYNFTHEKHVTVYIYFLYFHMLLFDFSWIRYSVEDTDPRSDAFLTPGSGIGKKSRSESRMNIPDHISEKLEQFLG